MKTALAAALILTLTAAQSAPERFRYLGRSGQFAILSTEGAGPQNARMTMVVLAGLQHRGENGMDSVIVSVRSDCGARTLQLLTGHAYVEGAALPEIPAESEARPVEAGMPQAVILDYACSGTAPAGTPVWIAGEDAARDYALARAAE